MSQFAHDKVVPYSQSNAEKKEQLPQQNIQPPPKKPEPKSKVGSDPKKAGKNNRNSHL